MKIKANGISINYQVDGADGAPWLVLSNSLATNLAMWDGQARELGRAFRVLRYDQRGHGATDAPAGRYAFELLIADALALMDALAIKKAHFGGLSMGGATALGLAQKHPDRLDRVIVCDSPCQSTPTSSQQWEERIVVAKAGHGGAGRAYSRALVSAGGHQGQSAAPRQGAPDDPHHAGQRLHRMRRRACRPQLCRGGGNGDAAGPVHGRREGRRRGAHAQAQRSAARLALRGASRRRAHFQPRPARGFHPRRQGFLGRQMRALQPRHAVASIAKFPGGALYLSSGSTLDQAPPSHFEAWALARTARHPGTSRQNRKETTS